ncbi:MAG: choice-of-anchor J domain-containing protein [Bacteroidetes bacterium]|nr:choice-of-anchor J domain-containing protein [Bacteroidota bacterium]
MKKITLLLLTLLFSFSGFSQFGGTGVVEGFESTTGPSALPSNNWALSTGNWLVFDNGTPGNFRWGISTVTTTPTQVYQGANAAYMNRETNFSTGQTYEDYLASPAFTVPANGQLRFWTRGFLIGNQGTVYQIKVAPAAANPTDPNSYLLVQQWTDADLVASVSQYEEKVVNLTDYVDLNVRIAFVMQQAPITAPFGDRWFVDNVQVVAQCFDPTALTATPAITSAQLSWTNPGTTSWEVELVPAAGTPTGIGTPFNGAVPSFNVTTTLPAGVPLTATTAYKYYVRAVCSVGVTSQWIGPFNFSTLSPGLSCEASIVINNLPYSTTDSTANYGDNPNIEGSPGTGCNITGNYLNGNDVVYSYTAPANGTINVTMTPTGTNSGVFAYDSCANVGVTCIGGAAGTTTTVRTFDLSVTAGQTYYFVISSINTTQTVGYTLLIQNVNCAPPTALAANALQTTANLSWAQGGSSSWEVVVQPAGAGVPAGAGTQTNINTNYPVPTVLTPNTNYEFYVRADCNDGTGNFSAWAGPFAFRTLCDAFTVPFQEGFNSTSTSEACWTVLNVNGDTDAWDMNYATNPFEGDQVAMMYTDFNAGVNDDWLISPQIILTGNQRLRYRYRVQSAGEPNDFRVMLSTNGTSPANFTTTLVPLASYNNITYMEAIVNLSAYSGPVNIAWHVPPGGLDGWRLYIDNVIIEDLPTCPEPSMLTATAVLSTSATLTWTNGNAETEWQVLALPCGSPAPAAGATGFVTVPPTGSPYTLMGLSPTTCYDVYIRAVCPGNDLSPWTGPATFTTQVAPPVCGGQYIDAGGIAGNYPNNSNSTVTICPPAGELVTVTFTSFNTEANWDALYVFDGNSITSPQISSTNGPGNGGIPAGGFWGTTIPGPFVSSVPGPDGCLTFNFRSDGSVNNPGWVANVTCAPAPTCTKPNNLTATLVTADSAQINWTQIANPDNSVATNWEVLVLPCTAPAPTATTTGGITTDQNPYTLTGLTANTCYKVYVRAVCSTTDSSAWSSPATFTTQCVAFTIPFQEGFNTGSASEACWTVLNLNGDTDAWDMNYAFNPYEGDQSAALTTDFNAGNNNDWLISPQVTGLNGNQRLRYRYRVQSAGEPNDFRVMLSTTGIDPASFTQTLVPLASYNNTTYLENVVLLTGVTGTINIGFHVPQGGLDGWRLYIDKVIIENNPTCIEPTALTVLNTTATSAQLSWTDNNNPSATQWEVLILPAGSAEPLPNLPVGTGILVNANPALITGLQSSKNFVFFVRAICSDTDHSNWSIGANFSTKPANDECADATFVPVNSSSVCNQIASGVVSGASPSMNVPPLAAPCVGTPDDDVWFQFIATNSYLNVALTIAPGASTQNLNFAVYSGTCGALTQFTCSDPGQLSDVLNGLTVGEIYYIRVYSNEATAQTVSFDICISTPSTCDNSATICEIEYGNTTGVDSLGTIGCLFTSPNPTFFTIQVTQSGPLNYLLTQSTTPGGAPDLDVDYAAWGPFTSQAAACTAINLPGGGFLAPGIGVPVTQQTGCSYSAAATENLNIVNAQAGQFYIILITNYSDDPGFISLTQTNINAPGAGQTTCCSDANFAYDQQEYCKEDMASNPVVTIAPNSLAGVFTSYPAGLVFVDTATGEVDLQASAPGYYQITNTLAPTSTCIQKVYYYFIRITEPQTATITYPVTEVCKNETTVINVTIAGNTNGTFAVSPQGGLYINADNGAITPNLSTPGIYTISYNLPDNGPCPNPSGSTTIEIKAVPNVVSPGNQTVCGSYELLPLTVGNYYTATNGGGTMLNAGDFITSTQDVYIYANNNGCTDEKVFTVTVNPEVVVDVIDDFGTCAGYNLPVLTSGNYYTGPNGTGTMLNAGDPILVTTTLYIYASNGLCSDEDVFTITIGGLAVTAPESGSYCNSYELPTPTLGNYYTEAGGNGTMFTLPTTITTTQTIYLYANVDGCVGEDSFTVTINTIDTPTVDITQPTCAVQTGTIEVTSPVGSSSGTPPSDLFISEVTDAETGSLTYVEIYNGTGSAKSLDDYKLKFYTFGTNPNNPVTENCNLGLTGTLANDATYVIKVSSNSNISGVTPDATFTNCSGVNNNDYIKLTTSLDVDIDLWGRTDGTIYTPNNQVGYTYRRISTATVPKTTWDAADWTALDPEDYSNVGMYTFVPVGGSNYDYSLDSGAYQTETTFSGVAPGTHTVTVRDVTTGCVSEPLEVIIDDVPTQTTPVVEFSYVTPVCQSSTTTLTPTLATDFYVVANGFTATPAGLIIDANTGEIDVTNSTAGIYTVKYEVLEDVANCLSGDSYTFVVEITNSITPVVDFTYTTPVCQLDTTTASPILAPGFYTGTNSNGFSATPVGLIIDPITGVIDVTNSAPNTYMITYSVNADASQCLVANASIPFEFIITPTINPVTTIDYPTSVCQNGTNPLPDTSATGFVTGGTYSEDTTVSSGLVINPTTGEIDLANSSTGPHTVLYTIPQDLANCQAFSQSSDVITIIPVVTAVTNFSYTTPVCANGTNPMPIPSTGFTTGGTYSYVGTGLDLNTTTGEINLANTTPATYTVTYTVTSDAGNCIVGNSSSASITINPVITPVTGFSYTSPVCADDVNQLPSLAAGFTTGASFTVTVGSGLIINPTTGEIDVQASNPGVYTISYSILADASICQSGSTSTAQFVINSPFDVVAYGECQGSSFVLTANPVNGSFDPSNVAYEWQNGNGISIGTTRTIVATSTGNYTVIVTSNGCSSTSAPFTVDTIACVIQKGISADGDGLNDNFELTGFDVKNLQIYNRYGMKVYSKSNYTNQWFGQSDGGDDLPDATYYYVIERNNGENITGWIYLNRAQ